MYRPDSAVSFKMAGFSRMPVARGKDRQAAIAKSLDVSVQHRHHFITVLNGERATGAEIILHIDKDQGISPRHRFDYRTW
jgi:hypothetical protein